MVLLVGVDLAWTSGRESGICVLEDTASRLRMLQLGTVVVEPPDFARRLRHLGDDLLVAIDAPLVLSPFRTAERELAAIFARFHASAYYPGLDFLARNHAFAGPDLATELAANGFSLDPRSAPQSGRTAIEVYPHAAHIVLFQLPRILKYKRGPLASRRACLQTYGNLLVDTLASFGCNGFEPAAMLSAAVGGRGLKRVEDQFDAVTCALVAASARRSRIAMFGCRLHGSIVTPGLPAGVEQPPRLCRCCAQQIDGQL